MKNLGKSLITLVPYSFKISNLFSIFYMLFILGLSHTTKSTPIFTDIFCPNTTQYSPNSTYQANLDALFSVLSSNAATSVDGFYNYTTGNNPPDVSYGLFLCRGDLSPTACGNCVSTSTTEAVQMCPNSKRVVIWYNECMLSYSNRSIFSTLDLTPRRMLPGGYDVADPTRFNKLLAEVMGELPTRASQSGSGKKFATGEAEFSSLQTIYGLAQCTPDIRSSDCYICLRDAISSFSSCCDGKTGGRVMYPSCFVRYSLAPFYTVSATVSPPQPPPLLPSPPPPTRPQTSTGKGGISSPLLTAIIVPVGVLVLFFVVGFCFLLMKAQKTTNKPVKDQIISTVDSLQYELGRIQAATNNFSEDNKIGEGGFGLVYKGTLPNGKVVAIKRLSKNSRQGAEQFKNEVVLVAKLQHRNLVRLLGFSLKGKEKILVYEFVPNKSLDKFLFDPQEKEKLDWPKRYKIVHGIARGMLYLHEDSQLKIIHRDLKAGNILLDGDLNAKISDFGMARIFDLDQTRAVTSRVVGTLGYISPEYASHGHFSVKSDVFSFGVLVLEIISGKRMNSFYQSDSFENLLSYAWNLWKDGTPLDLMDPTLEGSCSRNEVHRCIHIGLLCVQHDQDARPTMAIVVQMLNRYSALPFPQQPAFFFQNEEHATSSSKSILWSVNEASITDLDPR